MDLKPCPFCGQSDKLEYQEWNEQVQISDDDGYSEIVKVVFCNNHTVSAHVDIWQSRPIEDDLRAKLDKAREALKIVRHIIDTGLWPDGNYELNYPARTMVAIEKIDSALAELED